MSYMIKIIFVTLLWCSSLGFATEDSLTLAVTNPENTIMLQQSQRTLTINLNAIPATGFIWLLKAYNPDLLQLSAHQHLTLHNKIPGASGIEVWTFILNPKIIAGPQLTHITFIQARPWDLKNTANKNLTFNVIIE